jgi:hypothetical protein
MKKWLKLGYLLLPAYLSGQDFFQISGYIQGRFTDREGISDRLEIRRARVIASGDLPDLSYTVQVDVAHLPYLLDASVTWRYSAAFRLTAGQFKIPFSTESLVPDNLDIPIERARAVNSLAPGRDSGVQARDTGVQAAGTVGPVDYAAGIFSGQLIVNSPAVHYRAIAGRLLVHPLKGLTTGGDWYSSFATSTGPAKRRGEVEGRYEHGPMQFASEQIFARDGSLYRRGGYGGLSWRLSPHWEPLTRLDWLTTNTHKANTTSIVYMAGTNFYFTSHFKIGINTGAQHDQAPNGFRSLFLAQAMFGF